MSGPFSLNLLACRACACACVVRVVTHAYALRTRVRACVREANLYRYWSLHNNLNQAWPHYTCALHPHSCLAARLWPDSGYTVCHLKVEIGANEVLPRSRMTVCHAPSPRSHTVTEVEDDVCRTPSSSTLAAPHWLQSRPSHLKKWRRNGRAIDAQSAIGSATFYLSIQSIPLNSAVS